MGYATLVARAPNRNNHSSSFLGQFRLHLIHIDHGATLECLPQGVLDP